MRSEVGIDPQSLSYGFLNEIMTHSWLDGGPRITRLGCTKFYEGYTKGPKMRHDRLPITLLWVSKRNYGPSMLKWGSRNLSDRMYQI